MLDLGSFHTIFWQTHMQRKVMVAVYYKLKTGYGSIEGCLTAFHSAWFELVDVHEIEFDGLAKKTFRDPSEIKHYSRVAAKKQTLKNVTDYIADVICKRAELGYNYGVILIPEGLIDFIPEVQQLIAELNEILAHDVVDEAGQWKKKLRHQSQLLFEFLPEAIQEQLMLERDPHGNVQAAKIETEKMLISMVETELEKRKSEGKYAGQFKGQSHFFGQAK